jgi:hypothetical protein
MIDHTEKTSVWSRRGMSHLKLVACAMQITLPLMQFAPQATFTDVFIDNINVSGDLRATPIRYTYRV